MPLPLVLPETAAEASVADGEVHCSPAKNTAEQTTRTKKRLFIVETNEVLSSGEAVSNPTVHRFLQCVPHIYAAQNRQVLKGAPASFFFLSFWGRAHTWIDKTRFLFSCPPISHHSISLYVSSLWLSRWFQPASLSLLVAN